VLKYFSINYKQLKLIMPYTQFGDWAQSTGGETSCSHPRRKQNNFFDKYLKCKEKVLEIGDSDALTELTGWKPMIDLDTTMKDLLQYWVDKIK
jgi:hypothetical protein